MTDEKMIEPQEKLGPNPELYIQDYIEKSVNHFSGEEIRIEVEYTPGQVTNGILYDFAGPEMEVKRLENGRSRVKFTKMESVTLVGWFMQYSNMFEVVEPVHLRGKILERLEEARKEYE